MRLKEFITEIKIPEEIPKSVENDIIEFLLDRIMIRGRGFPGPWKKHKLLFKEFNANYSGKYPRQAFLYTICRTYSDVQKKIDFALEGYEIVNGRLNDVSSNVFNFPDQLQILDVSLAPPIGRISEVYIQDQKFSKFEDWLPHECKKLTITDSQITSLSGIDKFVKKCNKFIFEDNQKLITSGVLSLLKIEGLRSVEIHDRFNKHVGNDGLSIYGKLNRILNFHLQTGRPDILECQSDLLDAGLQDYAKV